MLRSHIARGESTLMAGANVLEINDLNFDAEVLKADVPFLLDFSAVWCQPCRALAPVVAKLAEDYAGKARVGTLDIDIPRRSQASSAFAGSRPSSPSREEERFGRHVGVTNRDTLVRLLGL